MWANIKTDTRLVPGLITAAIGLWMCWLGVNMPRPRGWSSSPGLFPVIIGVGLVLMALALLLERRRILKADADRRAALRDASALESRIEALTAEPPMTPEARRRTIAVTGAIALYIVALSYLSFEVSTFLFLVTGMLIFGERSYVRVLLVSVASVLFIAITFIYFLQTLLPGNGSLVENVFFGL